MLNARIKFSLQNRVAIALLGLSLCIFLNACTPNFPKNQPPIDLNFRALSENELFKYYDSVKFFKDTILFYCPEIEVYEMMVKNNAYDSLFIPVLKDGENLKFLSGSSIKYQIEADSLILIDTSSPIFCGSYNVHLLLKGQEQPFYFEGYCSLSSTGNWYKEKSQIYKYRFAFKADSLGEKKMIKLWQFPCENTLPIKK